MASINVTTDEKTKAKLEFIVQLTNSVLKPTKKKSEMVSQVSIVNGLLEEFFARADNAEYLRLFEERGEFGALLAIQEKLKNSAKNFGGDSVPKSKEKTLIDSKGAGK